MLNTERKLTVGLLLCGASLLSLAGMAGATSMSVGDPFLGHSWDQNWSETSAGGFDTMTALILNQPGSTFESPGIVSIGGGWTVTPVDATGKAVAAFGATQTSLQFTTRFNGNPSDYTPSAPFQIELTFLKTPRVSLDSIGAAAPQLVDMTTWTWDGSGWSTGLPGDGTSPVPDGGASLLLLGLGSLGVAGFRKLGK